jgi:hypothetical protein
MTKNTLKNESRMKRIIMLTDMDDTEGNNQLIEAVNQCSNDGIFISIIGIGFSLNTSLTEKVSKTRGFNYFAATKEDHMEKIVATDFDMNFFPIAYDINLFIESGDFSVEKVYGTNFDNKLQQLANSGWKTSEHFLSNKSTRNNVEFILRLFKRLKNKILPKPILASLIKFWEYEIKSKNVCEISSCTPTEISGDGKLQGKFFIVKCNLKNNLPGVVNAKLTLNYTSLNEEKFSHQYLVRIPIKENVNYVEENMKKGLSVFYFAKFFRKMLRSYNDDNEESIIFLEEANLNSKKESIEKVFDSLLGGSEDGLEVKKDFIEKLSKIISNIIENKKEPKNDNMENSFDSGPRRFKGKGKGKRKVNLMKLSANGINNNLFTVFNFGKITSNAPVILGDVDGSDDDLGIDSGRNSHHSK